MGDQLREVRKTGGILKQKYFVPEIEKVSIFHYWMETQKTIKEVSEDKQMPYHIIYKIIDDYCKQRIKHKTNG
jgi:hypothetical protein